MLWRFFSLAVVLLLSACSHTVQIPVPSSSPLELVTWHHNDATGLEEPAKVLLQSSAPQYRQLQDWIRRNQTGWSRSLAPSTDRGVFVHSDALHLHLQFEDTTVSVFTDKGDFHKDIRKEEYAFLKPLVGI